jgi:hypothetical protein
MFFYLWCHEFWGATERAGSLTMPHLFFAKAIISHFNMPVQRQQDVVQLQVTMVIFNNQPGTMADPLSYR